MFDDLPSPLQAELLSLVATFQDLSLVEATMRLRALQELNEALGSDALFQVVAALLGGA